MRGGPEPLPLALPTPREWAARALERPVALLHDHAHLERKAAVSALYLVAHWPVREGIVERMSAVAREELEHLERVHRILRRRGARLGHEHHNEYVRGLQDVVRKGTDRHLLDRLLVAGLIEARSCERFERLSEAAGGGELGELYASLTASERGHYKVFLNFARREYGAAEADARFAELVALDAELLERLPFAHAMHSGLRGLEARRV